MADRRYDDDEIAAIFRVAVQRQQEPPRPDSRADGLTLAELKDIGKEVGISGDAVTQAAQLLEVRKGAVSRRFLGLPVGVERTVMLDRRLTDDEWERLVVELREVFHARGATRSDGSLRQWTNGNLHVLLEPMGSVHRLRFGTIHGGARASITAGLASLGMAGIFAVVGAAGGTLAESMGSITFLLGLGATLVASGALRLPGWARLRGRQMDALAAGLAISPSSTNASDDTRTARNP